MSYLTYNGKMIQSEGHYVSGFAHIFQPKYGLYYNWFAVIDASNIANDDWHVPSRTDWGTLTTYLGGESVAGADVKVTGYDYWKSPNTGATNSAKLNVIGAGGRNYTGVFGTTFNVPTEIGWFWSTTQSDAQNAWEMGALYNSTFFGDGVNYKTNGYSDRLIKDSTSLSDGQTGTYIGNDGKTYRTICIGSQEWLADNLAETKYRDGTPIPEVTGAAAWAALTTGGLCAYNNDWANAFITQSGNVRPKLMFIGAGIDNNLILSKSAIL